VCGCADQRVGNTTIQATNAPSEVPTASMASGAHRAATNVHPSATPTTAPWSTTTPMPSVPLTGGTNFPCIHETPDRTSVGVVTKVIDGDTIHVLINGTDYKVRYIGMNAPEDTTKKEWLGPEATARDKELVAGKTVTLVKDVSETDQYGRLLRFVFVGNMLVNYELVREGYAKATPYKPDVSCEGLFYDAQLQAQQAHLGLWSTGAAS
ncbi:MAG TPA: thermonuclease family protein, partial [Candidatus Acidoferrales bacterium]|nr:thermonuclease family protein [Candidatus Acidoferrales bacterium]